MRRKEVVLYCVLPEQVETVYEHNCSPTLAGVHVDDETKSALVVMRDDLGVYSAEFIPGDGWVW